MIGLQARGEPPGQSQRIAEPRDYANLGRYRDQILQPHDFGNGRGHFGRKTGRQRGQNLASGMFAQQPVAKIAHRKMGHGCKCRPVVLVENQPCNFIRFIGDHGLAQESL